MIRVIAWTVLWTVMLGAPTIRVKFQDGLTITLKGWA